MPADHLFVTFKVTREGEQGHSMDHVLKRVDVDPAGDVEGASLAALAESLRREIRRKARPASAPPPDSGGRGVSPRLPGGAPYHQRGAPMKIRTLDQGGEKALTDLAAAAAAAQRCMQEDTDHPSFCVVPNSTVRTLITAAQHLLRSQENPALYAGERWAPVTQDLDEYGADTWPAVYDPTKLCNGFVYPRFRRTEAELIRRHMDQLNAAAVPGELYDTLRWDGDVLVHTSHEYARETPAEVRIEPDERGLYPIGHYGWSWQEAQDRDT